jgi:hypothetical protein
MTYSLTLHRALRTIGLLLVFSSLCWFGYMVVPDAKNEQADSALRWALILYLLTVGEKWLFKIYAQKRVWSYIKAAYANHYRPTDSLAGPILNTDASMLDASQAYQIPLSATKVGYLAQVDVTRRLNNSSQFRPNYMLSYLVLSVDLGVSTPHIFIDGRLQNHFRRKNTDLWSLTKLVSKKNKINDLEGDFYRYFDVYTANREYLSALTIVTPDVMLVLRNQGYSFDYEIHNGHLYVISETNVLLSETAVQAMIKAMQSCLNELIPQITKHRYHDTHQKLALNIGRLHRRAVMYSLLIVGKFFVKIIFCVATGTLTGGLIKEITL